MKFIIPLLLVFFSCKPSIGDHLKVQWVGEKPFVLIHKKLYPIKGSGMGGFYYVFHKEKVWVEWPKR